VRPMRRYDSAADMDEVVRIRRKDTTKGPPLRILSLDGGGIRGYSMLIILQELMHRTFVEIEGRAPKRHEIPKPCDHFDLIVGTGTGGLIALMLGRELLFFPPSLPPSLPPILLLLVSDQQIRAVKMAWS
jgi:hypothetical protein